MRAVAVPSYGVPPAISDLPVPPAEDAVLVRVTYAGLNPVDFQLADQLTPDSTFPFVLGVDVAGVAEKVPAQPSDVNVGDRVFGMARTHGSYAEYTAVPAGSATEPLARIPDGIPDEQAAVLPVAGIAAFGSLDLLALSPAERVVIVGAAGAVGGCAVQIARGPGGVHVTAMVRGPDEAHEARLLGADEVYDVETSDYLALKRSHPDGVDAVLDVASGPTAIQRSAEILKPGGRLVSTVFAANVNWFAEREIQAYNIVGHTTPLGGTPNPKQSPQGLAELAQMLSEGAITTRIRSSGDINDALTLLGQLRNGEIRGKAVIRLH